MLTSNPAISLNQIFSRAGIQNDSDQRKNTLVASLGQTDDILSTMGETPAEEGANVVDVYAWRLIGFV